ncbi:DMT family transporter [Rhodobacter ferrooxidans]|uniref:DMT family transporter n=1 Tax=Rhodobacter ferrooxidans TaxID=371731 RepID=UPI001E4EFBB7|nr:DMT family transporter [Rhodobacter sp. SW2]
MSFESVWAASPELAFLGIGSTALASGFQTIAQHYTSASHAAVIVSVEGAFVTFAAAIILGERVTPLAMLGAALILAAIFHLAFAGNPKHAAVPGALT